MLEMLFHLSKCNWMKSKWRLVEDIAVSFLKAAMACWKLHICHYALNKMRLTDFWCLYLGYRLDDDNNHQFFHNSMLTQQKKRVSGTYGLYTWGHELQSSSVYWKLLNLFEKVWPFGLEASSMVCPVNMWGYRMTITSASKVSILYQLEVQSSSLLSLHPFSFMRINEIAVVL